MTGFGEARYQSDQLTFAVELRALNNRYLKVSVRATEPYNLLEPEFEKVIRRTIRRGTVHVNLRCQRQYSPQDYKINEVALKSYLEQLRGVWTDLGPYQGDALLGQALALPGVVAEPGSLGSEASQEWPLLERVLEQALGRLQTMRLEEGRAMGQEFLQLRSTIADQLAFIRARAPQVGDAYRDRLHERVRAILAEH